jgi:hypothetical protein
LVLELLSNPTSLLDHHNHNTITPAAGSGVAKDSIIMEETSSSIS